MKIIRTSIFSGITRTLDLPITETQLSAWKSGTLIQKAMPQLSADQREFVMTGVTNEEWDKEFSLNHAMQLRKKFPRVTNRKV